MYKRAEYQKIKTRLEEERKFIQVVMGARQIGKSTVVKQVLKDLALPYQFFSADNVPATNSAWVSNCWAATRSLKDNNGWNSVILVIDEIQKIANWSEVVKKEWDDDTFNDRNIKVLLLGSSRVLLEKGLSESLAGRFEEIRRSHWSYIEMKECFGFNVDQYLFYGGYPGAATLIADSDRFEQYIQSAIIDATINHCPLEFGYTTARGEEHKYVLHPYYVKQYNGRWFVFGWDDENKRITNLAIDRILSLTKSNRKFINNTVIDFNNYFDKIIGVTMPNDLTEDPVQIELKFSPNRFKYVVSKPLHPLQNTIERECIVVLNLYPNKELKQQIFSFGADVEVLSPKWFREEIKQDIEKCFKLYSTMQKECTSVE